MVNDGATVNDRRRGEMGIRTTCTVRLFSVVGYSGKRDLSDMQLVFGQLMFLLRSRTRN